MTILIVFACVAFVAISGPLKLNYHDTSKNNWYFYHNFTNFGKTLLTMYITQTTANFPDVMVFKYNEHQLMFGLLFYLYYFIMSI